MILVGLDAAAVLVNFFKAVINRDGIQGRKKTPFDATAGVLINETRWNKTLSCTKTIREDINYTV